jgi:HEAT repeat protein
LWEVSRHRGKEGVVRALAVRAARGRAFGALAKEFAKSMGEPDQDLLRWAIANSMAMTAEEGDFEALAELARNPKSGNARQMLAEALGRMKDPRAVGVLLELLDIGEVAGHAIEALGRLRATGAKSAVTPFLSHPKAWIRSEAEKALRCMGEG